MGDRQRALEAVPLPLTPVGGPFGVIPFEFSQKEGQVENVEVPLPGNSGGGKVKLESSVYFRAPGEEAPHRVPCIYTGDQRFAGQRVHVLSGKPGASGQFEGALVQAQYCFVPQLGPQEVVFDAAAVPGNLRSNVPGWLFTAVPPLGTLWRTLGDTGRLVGDVGNVLTGRPGMVNPRQWPLVRTFLGAKEALQEGRLLDYNITDALLQGAAVGALVGTVAGGPVGAKLGAGVGGVSGAAIGLFQRLGGIAGAAYKFVFPAAILGELGRTEVTADRYALETPSWPEHDLGDKAWVMPTGIFGSHHHRLTVRVQPIPQMNQGSYPRCVRVAPQGTEPKNFCQVGPNEPWRLTERGEFTYRRVVNLREFRQGKEPVLAPAKEIPADWQVENHLIPSDPRTWAALYLHLDAQRQTAHIFNDLETYRQFLQQQRSLAPLEVLRDAFEQTNQPEKEMSYGYE